MSSLLNPCLKTVADPHAAFRGRADGSITDQGIKNTRILQVQHPFPDRNGVQYMNGFYCSESIRGSSTQTLHGTGIFTYIGVGLGVNVGIHGIHGVFGLWGFVPILGHASSSQTPGVCLRNGTPTARCYQRRQHGRRPLVVGCRRC